MTVAFYPDALEFHSDPTEQWVVGGLLVIVGTGALLFWNVERGLHWPPLAILLLGGALVGLGLFLFGFCRVVRLQRGGGISERQSWFGLRLFERRYRRIDFAAIGSHAAVSDGPWWDVVLFRPDGSGLTLCRLLARQQAGFYISRVAQVLELPAEAEPRTRVYVFR